MSQLEAWKTVALDIAWFARWPVLAIFWSGFGYLAAINEKEKEQGRNGTYPDESFAFVLAFVYTFILANWGV